MTNKDLVRKLRKGPDLDQYLKGRKKRYTTYGLGAGMYSLNYYSFVRLCKEAGANIQIKKKVVVDLDILDAYLSLSEICSERNQSYVPAADPNATSIPFTGLANIESNTGIATQELTPAASIKSSVKRYEPKDIVFSKMRPALRKVAVMNMPSGGYVSSECTVFTVREDSKGEPVVDPEILSAILRSDFVYGQIMSCVTGIGRPRISGKDLRKILIPLPDKQLQTKVMQSLKANQASIKQLKDRAEGSC